MSRAGYLFHRIVYALSHRIRMKLGGDKRGRLYFEYLYSRKEDPWDYRTSDYELTKYRKSLELLPRQSYSSVLEIGCSVGVFTRMISERAARVDAIDISKLAVRRARKACEDVKNVHFETVGMMEFRPARRYDLVCAAEVLYYLADDDQMIRRTVGKIDEMLAEGGNILYVAGGGDKDRFNDWESYFTLYGKGVKNERTEILHHPFGAYRISILEKQRG